MELVHDSLIGTREVVTWYEGKFNPNLGKNGRMNLWLLPARFFSKKSSSQVTHFFSVCQGRSASKRAEMPEDRVPEERFEFNEDVHHDCKEMESPCGEAKLVKSLPGAQPVTRSQQLIASPRPFACLVTTRLPQHVMHDFVEMWLTHQGVPDVPWPIKVVKLIPHLTC